MTALFISYRRSDSKAAALRIARIFEEWLTGSDDRVFLDTKSMRSARRWRRQLDVAVEGADAMVVVIGNRWNHRLREEDDVVRREVELAVELDLPIIPFLVNGASVPNKSSLPEELAKELLEWPMIPLKRGVSYDDQLLPIWEEIEMIAKELETAEQAWLLHMMRDYPGWLNAAGMSNLALESDGYELLADMSYHDLGATAERLCELEWFSYSEGESSFLYGYDPA